MSFWRRLFKGTGSGPSVALVRDSDLLQAQAGLVWAVALARDGTCAVSGDADNTVRLWDVAAGRCVKVLKGHGRSVTTVALSRDGKLAISGSEDFTIRLWDLSRGRCIRVLGTPQEGACVRLNMDGDIEGAVCSVSLSNDDKYVLAASAGGEFAFAPIRAFLADGVYAVEPSGKKHLVSTYTDLKEEDDQHWDGTLQLWELATGRCVKVIKMSGGTPIAVLTGDGTCCLSRGSGCTLDLWELATGTCLRTFEGHTERVSCVSVSDGGAFAISGSSDKTLRAWDVATGHCLRTFEGHTERVSCVSLSANGALAISGSFDTTLRLWDVATGHCLRTFEGHTDRVSCASLSADGARAISGSFDKTLRLWDVATGSLIATLGGRA
jgi:WD40 repeat protein